MSFNFGSFGGGVISGAGAGSAFGPVGAGIGAALGGISSLFGGGGSGGTQFLPSDLMQAYMDIGLADVEPPKWKKKADLQQFRTYVRSGDRGAGEDLLRELSELYPQEKKYAKKLKKSLQKDVNFYDQVGWEVADQIYKNAGLGFTGEEFADLASKAKSSGIRGSGEFGDFLKQQLIAQGKVRTPQEEALDLIFGTPGRKADGTYLGRETLLRGPVTGPSQNVVAPVTYQYQGGKA